MHSHRAGLSALLSLLLCNLIPGRHDQGQAYNKMVCCMTKDKPITKWCAAISELYRLPDIWNIYIGPISLRYSRIDGGVSFCSILSTMCYM